MSESAFEKYFYNFINKLRCLGITMDNLRKRVDIKLVKTDGNENKQPRKIIAKPNFTRLVKFSDELSAIHVNKTNYNRLKKKYDENCTLL